MGPEFFETPMGQRFYNGSIPALVEQAERIANALEELNGLLKQLKNEKTN